MKHRRYIDADELISWIVNEPSKVGDKDIPLNNEYDGSAFRQIEILGHIESMQTADVVEKERYVRCRENADILSDALSEYQSDDIVKVVRCKECLMHNACRFEQGLGLDGYCSQGERKTDDAEIH